jgi:hypothetical protein
MRMIAPFEALVVLLASVTACGPRAAGQSVRPGAPRASSDQPLCSWERAPAHPSLLAYQITGKEGSWLQQSTKPGRITAAGTTSGVKVDPSCVRSPEPCAAFATVAAPPSLLSLCCLLIV